MNLSRSSCLRKHFDILYFLKKHFSVSTQEKTDFASKYNKYTHCYNSLFPWNNLDAFSEHLATSIVYNKDGLIALNKPFGIRNRRMKETDQGSKTKQNYLVSPIPECELSVEDSLEPLKKLLNVEKLSILKSAERYTSGLVLLSSDDKTTAAARKSFNTAKFQKRTHLTHWMITLGYPVVSFREERVALKFLESSNAEMKQPVILTEFSRNQVKRKEVHPFLVVYRTLSMNPSLATSLVEISTSSVAWHLVRVYASNRITTILGDVLYSCRMNTFLGMPVNLHIEQVTAFNLQPLSESIAKALNVEKGVTGHSRIPMMLHLRSIILPLFKGEDLVITADLPTHFQWTAKQLKLL